MTTPERTTLPGPCRVSRILLFLCLPAIHACSQNSGDEIQRPQGVPKGAIWKYVNYISEPPGARIEVNDNYIGLAPCRGPIWVKGHGQAVLRINAYPGEEGLLPQRKTIWVPPVPDTIYFNLRTFVSPPDGPVEQRDGAGWREATDYPGPLGGHWIQEISSNGKFILLEDGSIWEVDDVDQVFTSIWLPVTEVVIVARRYKGVVLYEMLNTDDGESAFVRFAGVR